MLIRFGNDDYKFRPWRPELGRVFAGPYAMDTETTMIDEERPWLAPAYVLGAAFDGRAGYFILRERVGGFLAAHDGVEVGFHNAPFDLDVLNTVAPGARVYDWVDRDKVTDTQLLHRLYVLGTEGHTAGLRGESTLERCAEQYLNVSLPKDVADAAGREVRLSYDRWLNRPPADIEPVYLEYLAKDAIATHLVRRELNARLGRRFAGADGEWGFVSKSWLATQVSRWGPQTHHIQLKAAIVLRAITAHGLSLDIDRTGELARHLDAELARGREALKAHGYLPGEPGAGKALQAILRRLEHENPGVNFPRTDGGQFSTSQESLSEVAAGTPFLRALADYKETEKLRSSFVGKMQKRVLHPSFDVLARTGRTTSFGDLNAQNLPRTDAIRACFVPGRGRVFLKADFVTVEMATLAQAQTAQFGRESAMAAAINGGKDLHKLVAARVTGKPEADVTADERQMAKPINFGKPGAMGLAALKQYALASYRVALADDAVKGLSDAWLGLFPEMVPFLESDTDLGKEVAVAFGLTPASHYEHTGSGRFRDHPENAGRAGTPNAILGWMFLKTLADEEPRTRDGRPYREADVDYFWSRAEEGIDLFPANLRARVHCRRPAVAVRRGAVGTVGRASVFTLTGRLRAGATFAARRNTVFQGLAADGAKLALWNLWRAGFRIANFVHDEVLVEVPADADLARQAETVRRLMIDGMRAVVPDVRVDVEYAACDRWYKKAEARFSEDKTRLLLWQPPPPKQAGRLADRQRATAGPDPGRPHGAGKGRGKARPATA